MNSKEIGLRALNIINFFIQLSIQMLKKHKILKFNFKNVKSSEYIAKKNFYNDCVNSCIFSSKMKKME